MAPGLFHEIARAGLSHVEQAPVGKRNSSVAALGSINGGRLAPRGESGACGRRTPRAAIARVPLRLKGRNALWSAATTATKSPRRTRCLSNNEASSAAERVAKCRATGLFNSVVEPFLESRDNFGVVLGHVDLLGRITG